MLCHYEFFTLNVQNHLLCWLYRYDYSSHRRDTKPSRLLWTFRKLPGYTIHIHCLLMAQPCQQSQQDYLLGDPDQRGPWLVHKQHCSRQKSPTQTIVTTETSHLFLWRITLHPPWSWIWGHNKSVSSALSSTPSSLTTGSAYTLLRPAWNLQMIPY